MNILLIEDDDDYTLIVKNFLESSKLQVDLDVAINSKQALEKLQANSFDCVLSDYIVPTTTGFDIMQEARKMGLNVPFIILTGFGDGGLGNELIERGAADFVSKEELGADMLVSKISAVVDKNN